MVLIVGGGKDVWYNDLRLTSSGADLYSCLWWWVVVTVSILALAVSGDGSG